MTRLASRMVRDAFPASGRSTTPRDFLLRFSTVAGEKGAADAERDLHRPTAMWDFWSLIPESLHQVTILMSDRGLPVSPRFINGCGSHTYSFWNSNGERFWVKFHFQDPPVAPAPVE